MNGGIEEISSTSKKALITLYAHSLESQDENPILIDEMAIKMTDALSPILAKSESRLLRNLSKGKMSRALRVHIALRAKKYDQVAEDFIEKHPDGIVMNLGCGFDFRYQRLKTKPFLFIDLDLPEMINIKKNVFTETVSYRLIGQSIFNRGWLEQVKSYHCAVLFIAEGLFMYLHPEELNPWLKEVAESFPNSYLFFETVAEKYTRGLNQKMVEENFGKNLGWKAMLAIISDYRIAVI